MNELLPVLFLGILGVAFVYEIGRGGLEWD